MSEAPDDSDVTHCYRHPDRRAGVVCQRCGRPICSACMHQASVGFHCPECVRSGAQRIVHGPPVFDPIVTKLLIGINVAVFVWTLTQGGTVSRLSDRVLVDYGLVGSFRSFGFVVDGVAGGEWYRILTAGFLHDGLLHIGFNMYALWILGPALERALGRPRFVALYAAGLIGGSFGAMLLGPHDFTVGASGAIFALFGAVAVMQKAAGVSLWSSGIGPILALNLFLTFAVSSISTGGHVGGLLTGLVVGGLYLGAVRVRRRVEEIVAAVVVLTVMLAWLTVVVAQNPLV